jgi:hypothetical protein
MKYRVVENKEQQRPERRRVLYPLVLSDDFKAVLNNILTRGKSNVASRLLEWSADPENPPEDKNGEPRLFYKTYIDRTEDDDVITFLQANRIQRHIEQGGSLEGKEPWEIRGRAETRIGRIVREIFGTRFNQESIEKFVNKYKASIRAEKVFDQFELVKGEKIRYWYNREHYTQTRGSLGGSCMSGSGARNFFGIYEKNPDECGLCILKNEKGDKIRGRALVWKLTEPREGLYLMDRIYVADDADSNLFIQHSNQQGWAHLDRQTYNGSTIVLANGEKLEKVTIRVDLSSNDFNRYPYLDTLKIYYKKEKVLANGYISGLGKQYTLNDTGGYYNEHYHGDYHYEPTMVDDYLGNEILEDQAVWCEYDDAYCLRDDAIRVRRGEHGRGKWFTPVSKLVKYSEYSDMYYHVDDLKWSEYMKDWVYDRYAVKMYFDKEKTKWSWMHRLLLHDEMGKVDGDYYVNDILYREQIRGDNGKMIVGDYHFIDDEFIGLEQGQDEDDYFKNVPPDVQIDK